jgi:DNA polymerase-1
VFLDFDPGVKRKSAVIKHPPFIPDMGWRPPAEYPDLRTADLIALDVETKELDFEHGPGWARKAGHIVGFSLAASWRSGHRFKAYVPIRHEVQREWNCDPALALAWAKAMLESPVPKTGANLLYDVGWFTEENIFVRGKLYDVQFAQALLDEHELTALDYLAMKYLQRGKTSDFLYEWCARAYGGAAGPKQRANIYRAPPAIVGPYAEDDADLCLDILPKQWFELRQQELTDLFELECRLIPILIKMRRVGVRIDLNYAEQLYAELGRDTTEAYERLRHMSGMVVNVNSGDELAKLFDHVGIPYPRTEGGKPSFVKDFLKHVDHPVGKMVNEIRELIKIRSTFVRSYMLEKNVGGRIHGSFHPLKGEDGGTKTGRFASSDPNLQNIPVRSKLGKKVRKAFVPDVGHIGWEKNDYSQIEYRFLAHFAVGPGSDELRHSYISDPTTDYHDVVYFRACPFMGWNPEDAELKDTMRRPIKNTNFGLLYGQGEGRLAATMGFNKEQAKTFFAAYHQAAPYALPTMEHCAQEVHSTGVVKTILGRKTHFNMWQPIIRKFDEEQPPLPYEMALRRYGSMIKRAFDYRAINYKLQGSSADMMKAAMVKCDDDGVFDAIGMPRLTVHDELDFSVIDETPSRVEAHKYMRNVLENVIPLRIPIRVDATSGATWGDAK